MEQKVIIDSFHKVRGLQNAASQFPSWPIKVCDSKGSVADARSILGLMSLSYIDPVTICIDGDNEWLMGILERAIEDEGLLSNMFYKMNPRK